MVLDHSNFEIEKIEKLERKGLKRLKS